MSQFEFFMTFYGLLLGLAVAELFSGFARVLQERTPPRVGLMLPVIGLIALIELIATFIDAWASLQAVRSVARNWVSQLPRLELQRS